MKFTIFSGFFNNIQYFEQITQAVLSQTHTNWEWFISDDFSDCSTCVKDKVDKLNHPNIKFVKPRWKKEFYFNPPVEHSTGDIMIVLDVDDLPHPKLLEVYNRHYKKYPEVEMISCASIARNNNVKGNVAFSKITDFKGLSNYNEATNDPKKQIWRSLGDARSYRIRTRRKHEFAFKDEYLYTFCEDLIKTYNIELRGGKILYLPRILHTYVQASSNSISWNKYSKDVIEKQNEERLGLPKHIQGKFDSNEINTIDHRYSIDSHEVLNAIAYCDFYSTSKSYKLSIFNSNLSQEEKDIINEIYYDYKINYNLEQANDSDYLIFSISNIDDCNLLYGYKNHYQGFGDKKVIIRFPDEMKKQMEMSFGQFYWFSFGGYTTMFINQNLEAPA